MSTMQEVLLLIGVALALWAIASWLWYGFKLRRVAKQIHRRELMQRIAMSNDDVLARYRDTDKEEWQNQYEGKW